MENDWLKRCPPERAVLLQRASTEHGHAPRLGIEVALADFLGDRAQACGERWPEELVVRFTAQQLEAIGVRRGRRHASLNVPGWCLGGQVPTSTSTQVNGLASHILRLRD